MDIPFADRNAVNRLPFPHLGLAQFQVRPAPESSAIFKVLCKRRKGLPADMVLHALGIRVGDIVRHAERLEELADDLVTPAGDFGKLFAGGRKKDGTVRQRRDQAVAPEALDGAVDCDVSDAQSAGQLGHPRLPGGGNELRDHLHVILRRFLGIFCPGPLETDLMRGGSYIGGLGHSAMNASFTKKMEAY